MDRTKDQWGERFATCVNGVNIFAMGADYIPEDHLLGRVTPETRDKEFGGWYSGITSDGKILPNKQCYAHAFVILAASSAILAGKSDLYHAFQATLIPYNRVDLSIACAIKEKKDGGLE